MLNSTRFPHLSFSLSPTMCRIERRFVAIAYFISANIVRYMLTRGDAGLPLVEASYAAAPIVLWTAMRVRLPWTASVLATLVTALIATAADVIAIISRQYHWMPDAIAGYLDAWRDLPWHVIGPIAALVSLAGLLSLLALTVRGMRQIAIWPLIVLLVGLTLADGLVGASRWRDTTSGYDIVTVSSITTPMNALLSGLRTPQVWPIAGASMTKEINQSGHMPGEILSIAVESFGLARSPMERRALLAPLIDRVAPLYEISQSAHSFKGTTLAGELRELCALRIDGVPEIREPKLRQCLPARLHARGYATVAFHGNGGAIYNRARLYPAIGFNQSWFYDRLHREDPTAASCPGKAFAGICDNKVFDRALSLFDGTKRFVHVMTLDTHLPVARSDGERCLPTFRSDVTLCAYSSTMRASLKALGSAIVSAAHHPDLIILYGDHAPPFSSTSDRAHFCCCPLKA